MRLSARGGDGRTNYPRSAALSIPHRALTAAKSPADHPPMFKRPVLSLIVALAVLPVTAHADQFTLFDKVFNFSIEEAIPTKSHLFVKAAEFGKGCPKDWTTPVDYRRGSVHIRMEVLQKPIGEAPTNWSLCYIPNKGQKNGYGCTGSPTYTKPGVYEKDVKMTEFWNNDSIVWTKGVKQMALVIKDTSGGQGHAHKRKDHEKYFPTRIRITMIQVSAGAKYDPARAPKFDRPPAP